MYLKVLKLEYSEKCFSLMAVFNKLETCLYTIEIIAVIIHETLSLVFGPQK